MSKPSHRDYVPSAAVASKSAIVFVFSFMLLYCLGVCNVSSLVPASDVVKQKLSMANLAFASDGSHFVGVTTGTRADWGADPSVVHPFCAIQIKAPIPMNGWCKRDAQRICVTGPQAGNTPMFSQVGQDYYLFTRHFRHLMRRGVYAEVATRDPVTGSNTYFMDACLGWKGVCVEANPETFESINRVRSCDLVPTCVGAVDGQRVQFLMHADSGGVDATNKNKAGWAEADVGRNVTMQCMAMRAVLARRAIKTLDYLSLDVEGHELEVLRGFDWDSTTVNTMTIETTDDSLREIQKFLLLRGYVRHTPDLDNVSRRTGLLRRDAIFLHKDVEWGNPV